MSKHYAVFTMDKQKGNGGGLSAHIERVVWDAKENKMVKYTPSSVVNPDSTCLNKDYLLPNGGQSRTKAIEDRIKEAGITRKIKADAVKCLTIICTSDHEKMMEIEKAGRIDEWAKDCISFCQKEFGEANVVSAALHMDETTPHLHISVVPIVNSQAKKRTVKGEAEDKIKRRYKKQEIKARLCAKEVFTPSNSVRWQTEFAKLMDKYGMIRGIEGSSQQRIEPAKHNLEEARKQKEIAVQEMESAKATAIEEEQKAKEAQDKAKDAIEKEMVSTLHKQHIDSQITEAYDDLKTARDAHNTLENTIVYEQSALREMQEEKQRVEKELTETKLRFEEMNIKINELQETLRDIKLEKGVKATLNASLKAIKSLMSIVTGSTQKENERLKDEVYEAKKDAYEWKTIVHHDHTVSPDRMMQKIKEENDQLKSSNIFLQQCLEKFAPKQWHKKLKEVRDFWADTRPTIVNVKDYELSPEDRKALEEEKKRQAEKAQKMKRDDGRGRGMKI